MGPPGCEERNEEGARLDKYAATANASAARVANLSTQNPATANPSAGRVGTFPTETRTFFEIPDTPKNPNPPSQSHAKRKDAADRTGSDNARLPNRTTPAPAAATRGAVITWSTCPSASS